MPKRFSRAALVKRFPRAAGRKLVEEFSLGEPEIQDVVFEAGGTIPRRAETVRRRLQEFFGAGDGFWTITRLNFTDGVRITFDNGDVAHFRPSGNADELRIYAVAGTQERADQIAEMAVKEPDGILRRIERGTAG